MMKLDYIGLISIKKLQFTIENEVKREKNKSEIVRQTSVLCWQISIDAFYITTILLFRNCFYFIIIFNFIN